MSDCLFCKMVDGRMKVPFVYEDEQCIGIADIAPKAPHHYLLIPRQHIESSLAVDAQHEGLAGHLVAAAACLARQKGLDQGGFRLVFNTGADAGQTVFHLHLHLLGGKALGGMV